MSEEYTLKYFREHYIEHRGIQGDDKELVSESFMGGAHTLMLMMTNFLSHPDPRPEIRKLSQELNEYMTLKKIEAEANLATMH
jgi:hypothetical protein